MTIPLIITPLLFHGGLPVGVRFDLSLRPFYFCYYYYKLRGVRVVDSDLRIFIQGGWGYNSIPGTYVPAQQSGLYLIRGRNI